MGRLSTNWGMRFPLAVALVCLSLGFASPSWAQSSAPVCLLDGKGPRVVGMADCQKSGLIDVASPFFGDNVAVGSPYGGGRLNSVLMEARTPIDMHGYCRYVDNLSGNTDYFVPFLSSNEWTSFINNHPSTIHDEICGGRPTLANIDETQNLYFGTSSARSDVSPPDRSNASHFNKQAPDLPYWRKDKWGDAWPPAPLTKTFTFNHECYEEYSQDVCWKWVSQTCTETRSRCTAWNDRGACTATENYDYDYDCSYCGDAGSVCQSRWHAWSETFNFTAIAGSTDQSTYGWHDGQSHRIAGTTRPNEQCCARYKATDQWATVNATMHDCIVDEDRDTCDALPAPPTAPSCGYPNGQALLAWPGAASCTVGTPSNVLETSTAWGWYCQNQGQNVGCSATKLVVHGQCGSAHGVPTSTAPTTGLCLRGTASPVVDATTEWTWSCYGANTGSTATCHAEKQVCCPYWGTCP